MLIKYIIALLLFMITINLLMFLFILVKKIHMKILKNFREKEDNNLTELILTRDSNKSNDRLIKDIKRKLVSKNQWVRLISTFQAGEFDVVEANNILLKQLKLENRELLYVTARALIKLDGSKNLMKILNEVGNEERMEKNNVLALVEMIKTDIRDELEIVMLGSNTTLQILALEIYGKRNYIEGLKWIKKAFSDPLKEIRIASLKGALAMNNVVEEDYFNSIKVLENDLEWEVRAVLATFLGNVKTKESVNILSRLIKDPNGHVRNNAGNALGNQGDRGRESLTGLLHSKNRFVRDISREEIQKGLIYKDLFLKINNESDKETLIPKLDNGLLGINTNHES